MSDRRLWTRIRKARLFQVFAVYLAASWAILEVVEYFIDNLGLPPWASSATVVLLLIGFVVVMATGWVQSHPPTERGGLPQLTWPRTVIGGVLGLGVLLGLAALFVIPGDEDESPAMSVAGDAAASIAVLPFTVAGPELEEWREGLASLLSTGLDGAGGLRTVDSRTVFARWDRMVGSERRADQGSSLEVARRTGARYALLGSAVAIGPAVRLVADVYELAGSSRLGQELVEGQPDSVLVLADELAKKVLGLILPLAESDLPRVNLASVTTSSVPALKAFLEGETLYRKADFDGAIDAYGRALQIDSTFALAHYRVASSYAWSEGIQGPRARAHRDAALALVDRLPEREAALVRARHATGQQRAEAVELLEAAVNRYADDAEPWFLLGDAHLHTASLTGPEEADRAFARAAEIDPQFAMYQPHGVELAFNHHADSALAARRLEHYGEIAPASPYYGGGRLALTLAFGAEQARAAIFTALDTLPLDHLWIAGSHLQHPRYWETRERVLRTLRDRLEAGRSRAKIADALAFGSLWKRGKVERALEHLAHPATPTVSRLCIPAVAAGWGLPVPQSLLAQAMTIDVTAEPAHFLLTCRGYIAADLGRWEEHAAAVSAAEEHAREARAEGDAARADRLEAAALELRGYGLWRRGDPQGAVALLRQARESAWYLGEWPITLFRKSEWFPNAWLGQLLLAGGDPEGAEGHFLALWYNPFAHFRLGTIYEALGEDERARAAYEYFVEAWATADPAFQPLVDEARRAIDRVATSRP